MLNTSETFVEPAYNPKGHSFTGHIYLLADTATTSKL